MSNCITLGMEDHLLEIFGGHDTKLVNTAEPSDDGSETTMQWSAEAKSELQRIPGFVRKKIQKKTEAYALKQHKTVITPAVMFEAKEFFTETAV